MKSPWFYVRSDNKMSSLLPFEARWQYFVPNLLLVSHKWWFSCISRLIFSVYCMWFIILFRFTELFEVDEKLMGLALGKKGSNIKEARTIRDITSVKLIDGTLTIEVCGKVSLCPFFENSLNSWPFDFISDLDNLGFLETIKILESRNITHYKDPPPVWKGAKCLYKVMHHKNLQWKYK